VPIGLHVILILKNHWHNNLQPIMGKFAYEIIEWENHVSICAYVLWWSSCLDALLFHFFCIDPNFGLTTKAKAWQWEHVIRRMFQDLSTPTSMGKWVPNTPKCILMLGVRVLWCFRICIFQWYKTSPTMKDPTFHPYWIGVNMNLGIVQ
jgi:hypothetical protein